VGSITQRVSQMSPVKLALAAQAARARFELVNAEPIAIVGMGCRFPGGAHDPEAFWRLLRDGVDTVTEAPKERWDIDAYFDPDPDAAGKMYTRYGSFLDGVDRFDAAFFGISPREAALMDPQQRLMLEVSWEALERAGVAPARLRGTAAGVFVGMMTQDYSRLLEGANLENAYAATGNGYGFTAGRVAHTLGLQGPAMAIDTACSSSLVAVHLACQSLRAGESELALAGGVNLSLSPVSTIIQCRAKMLSPDGRCKTFDASANGYVKGEGCGVIVLRRLSDAMAAGNRILAVIRGSAVNHDGVSSGITVPNGAAQEQVIRNALAAGGVDPRQVSYIEAHGTGTALGDPIELAALRAVFREGRPPEDPLAVGSVKTNLGHLEGAAGIAGLMKLVLALENGEIPPHLHFRDPNPHFEWGSLPLRVATVRQPWAAGERRRIAGVSAFGFSGTNAHVVLEEAPAATAAGGLKRERHILTLSAKSEAALRNLAARYRQHLAENLGQDLGDVCFTAHTGRTHFAYRMSVVASTPAEAREKLAHAAVGKAGGRAPKIGFACPGGAADSTLAELWRSWGIAPAAIGRGGAPEFADCDLAIEIAPKPMQAVYDDLAAAYRCGAAIDWVAFERGSGYRPVVLPTYPFERERHWVQPAETAANSNSGGHPLLGRRLHLAGSAEIRFESEISAARCGFLRDHSVYGAMVLPAAAYLEMALSAAVEALGAERVTLTDIAFHQALDLGETEGRTGKQHEKVQLSLLPAADGQYAWKIYGAEDENSWALLASGFVRAAETSVSPLPLPLPIMDLASPMNGSSRELPPPDFYQRLAKLGIEYGASFRAVTALRTSAGSAFGRIDLPAGLAAEAFAIHPVLLDGCFQVCAAAADLDGEDAAAPVAIARFSVYGRPKGQTWAHATFHKTMRADLRIGASDGTVIAEVEGFEARRISRGNRRSLAGALYEVEWRPRSLTPMPPAAAIGAALAPAIAQAANEPGARVHARMVGLLEELSLRYAAEARWVQAAPQYHRLFARLLDALARAGSVPEHGAGERCNTLQSQHPEAALELSLLERCGSRLADVLRGECDPLSLLFPAGDTSAAAQLYRNSPGLAVLNTLLRQAVAEVANRWPEDRPLDILEIGGGTGGSTASILPILAPGRTRYTFTDVSPVFLAQARAEFAEYPFVEYRSLDVERPPETQAFERGRYDIVVAANVLHATRDLRETLKHVRGLLAPGGLLLLLEGTAPLLWADLTFGLTEGWWRFTDTDLRPAYPLLPVAAWQSLLRESDFAEALPLAPATESALFAQHAVIIAQAGTPAPRSHGPSQWLIAADSGGLAQDVAALLLEAGDGCEFVTPDAAFEQLPRHITGVLFFARIAADASDAADASLRLATEALHLIQALLRRTLCPHPEIWVITRGAAAGAGNAGVAQAPLWGLGGVLALEHPELQCRLIDLDAEPAPDEAAAVAAEIRSASRETRVSLRRAGRFVARLAKSARPPAPAAAIAAEAAYLITGGFGALGLLVANGLVARGARHLILLGRRGLHADAREAVRQLERAGASIYAEAGDASRASDVERVLARCGRELPPLRGVIHAAGLLDDGILMQQSAERFARLFAPKAAGAWNLHRLTRGAPLDFFVLFSSAASLVGRPGQANHAAANAFLDALAHHRRGLGLPGVSINWGAWSEVGEAAQRGAGAALASYGVGSIPPAEGIALLWRLLASPRAQIAVLPMDWSAFAVNLPHGRSMPFIEELLRAQRSGAEPAPRRQTALRERLANASPEDCHAAMGAYLQERLASILGLDARRRPDLRQPLQELGLDSLMAIELKNTVHTELGISLPIADFLEGKDIHQLAESLRDEFVLARCVILSGPTTDSGKVGDRVEVIRL
jgi:acyl transferase domain-containing protein/acyl carrier protein